MCNDKCNLIHDLVFTFSSGRKKHISKSHYIIGSDVDVTVCQCKINFRIPSVLKTYLTKFEQTFERNVKNKQNRIQIGGKNRKLSLGQMSASPSQG